MKLKILSLGQKAKAGGVIADQGFLERAAALYNPMGHEAPVYIGAEKDTTPAAGWIEKLYYAGGCLYAEARQMIAAIESDIAKGVRWVEAVGFYANGGLRHVRLSGAPIILQGIAGNFADKNQVYFEFYQTGGTNMKLEPKMEAFLRLGNEVHFGMPSKEFSEGDNPGEILHRKTMDILMSNPKVVLNGAPLPKAMDYSGALQEACRRHPDLAARYVEQLEQVKAANSQPYLTRGE